MRVRLRTLLAVAMLAVALGACSVDATVTIRMDERGSGEVTVGVVLDADAVRAVEIGGTSLADGVRLDDLAAAGWEVSPWEPADDGGAAISVSKAFSRPEQVRGIVGEISGPTGPLRRFAATRDASTFATDLRVQGVLDLRTVDFGVADDTELVQRLTNNQVDATAVAQRIAGEAVAGLRVRARVELPGVTEEVAAAPGERAAVVVTDGGTDVGRVLLVAGGVVAAVAAVVVAARGRGTGRGESEESPPVRPPIAE